jgi:hypothetical protein
MAFSPPAPKTPAGNPPAVARPTTGGPDQLPSYQQDEPAPAGIGNAWNEVDDEQLLAVAGMIRDAFVIRSQNGHRKESV